MPIGLLAKKEDAIDLSSLMKMLKDNIKDKNYGAIVAFIGVVRGKTLDGKKVEKLEYEVFEEIAKRSLENIANTIYMMGGIIDVAVCHKYGVFSPGEDVLYIIVAAERSEKAIDAIRATLEKVKHEIPIWKKEYTAEGAYWIGI
ncbi:MAG: molybdenum cofactor biosynthesis protein MoaE [Candidatus Methanomethyliaceae archaeon]|nr:molybdenum cofactor biosynthesis protein MoaE [Candidatus Methanomethyliaceae archaeon]MDW7970474.1 molybdenum cofactor biosynthesis protein MoaE [Nitrososphaerota archaeon]